MFNRQKTALELVKARQKRRSRIHLKKDHSKLALAVEGGGFSGVISMGMMMALKDLNLLRVFDVFIGCSAGSLNLAYTLGNADEEGLSVYYDHVINHKFFDAKRFIKGKYVLDMKVLEMIIRDVVPLPYQKLAARHLDDFYLCLTKVNPVGGHMISARQAGNDLTDYLLAGSTIPYFGGDPKSVRGVKYFDGTFAYPDLALAAEALACTHVLVLSTNPAGDIMADRYENVPGKSYKLVLSKGFPELEDFWQTRLEYSKQLHTLGSDLMASRVKSHFVAIPKTSHKMAGFTSDQWMIIDGARKGYQAVVNLFHPDATVGLVPEIL